MKRTINQTAKRSLKTKKAFTLVELLVVIAIIGILFVVLISKVDFATDKAKTAGVQTDFRSYQMAMKMVGMEQQGFTNDMNKLAAQLNKNLDPKLQVAVVDGKLTTEAEDPWGTEYQFKYYEPANTRGEIVVRSAGPDLQYETDDDIVTIMRYELGVNGGSVVIATEQLGVDEPVTMEDYIALYGTPGLYDPATNELIKTWDEMLTDGDITISGTVMTGNDDTMTGILSMKSGLTNVDALYAPNLTGLLISDGVSELGDHFSCDSSTLEFVIIPDSVTRIYDWVFSSCYNLKHVIIGTGLTEIQTDALTIPGLVLTIYATTPPTESGDVMGHVSEVRVPAESLDAYKSSDKWGNHWSGDLTGKFKPIQ